MAAEDIIEQQILEQLRQICAALPGFHKIVSHGQQAFSNKKGIFVVLEEYRGDLSFCVNVGHETQGLLLKDNRFYRMPYRGRRGWVP